MANQLSKSCIKWIEDHCYVPEGRLVGQPFKLSDEQKKWLVEIYDSPTRLFILSMARKNGKTAFSACLLLLHLAGPVSRPNSNLYSAARSREQAAILFTLAAKIVRQSPTLSPHIGIRDTAKELYCRPRGTVYRALSADATTAHGLSPVFVVHDELGQVRGPRDDLYEALETAGAGQESPLSIVISTQAPTDGDLLSMLIDDAMSEGGDPLTKARLYTAPPDADPFSEESIKAANPHYDVFMSRDEVQRQAAAAKRLPSREAAYRNLILNQRVEARDPFVSRQAWVGCGAGPKPLDGRKIWAGLDLSSVRDLTALVAVGIDGDRYDVEATFWLPGDGIKERSHHDRVPYDVWADDGYLQLTPGKTIDYQFVAHELRKLFDRCDVQALAFDRWGMRHLIPWLEKAGFTEDEIAIFKPFGQGYKDMSPALRALEGLILEERLRHGMQPVLTMCAANAVAQGDPAGNRKLAKDRSSGRIDGMVALAMAVGVAGDQTETTEKDYGVFFI